MRFAQTMVDDPKYGASSRDAVISVASAPIPAPKTSAPSARLPGLSLDRVHRILVIYRPKTRSISPSVRAASNDRDRERRATSTSQKRTPAHRVSRCRFASAARRARWNRYARWTASGSSGGSSSGAVVWHGSGRREMGTDEF